LAAELHTGRPTELKEHAQRWRHHNGRGRARFAPQVIFGDEAILTRDQSVEVAERISEVISQTELSSSSPTGNRSLDRAENVLLDLPNALV
jgi:hypothetical protein